MRPLPHIASASAVTDILWLKRDCLAELAALVQSIGVSLGESAWRGCDQESAMLVRQLRVVALEAIALVKELGAANGGGAS